MICDLNAHLAIEMLTTKQRVALKLAAGDRIYKVTGGWRGRGTPMIHPKTAEALVDRGLAATPLIDNRRRLVATEAARAALQGMEAAR